MPWGFQQSGAFATFHLSHHSFSPLIDINRSGVLGGAIVSVIVAWLSYKTARMLLDAQILCFLRTGEAKSYPEITGPPTAQLNTYVQLIDEDGPSQASHWAPPHGR